jgi:hypothetical protein
MSTIKSREDMEQTINQLYKNVIKILLQAEQKCCKVRHESEWSVAIHICSIMCKYWLKVFKGAKNNINVKQQLELIYVKLPDIKKQELTHITKTKVIKIYNY